MKNFIATYESPKNIFSGKKLFRCANIAEAQDQFFAWLRTQSTYQHMWALTVSFEEVQ
jgi:hypothetical protein